MSKFKVTFQAEADDVVFTSSVATVEKDGEQVPLALTFNGGRGFMGVLTRKAYLGEELYSEDKGPPYIIAAINLVKGWNIDAPLSTENFREFLNEAPASLYEELNKFMIEFLKDENENQDKENKEKPEKIKK